MINGCQIRSVRASPSARSQSSNQVGTGPSARLARRTSRPNSSSSRRHATHHAASTSSVGGRSPVSALATTVRSKPSLAAKASWLLNPAAILARRSSPPRNAAGLVSGSRLAIVADLRGGCGGSWPLPAPHSLMVRRPAKLSHMTGRSDTRTVSRPGGVTALHRTTFLELAPLPGAIPSARLHAVAVLYEWGLRDLADDAALIVSELMTNAADASAALP